MSRRSLLLQSRSLPSLAIIIAIAALASAARGQGGDTYYDGKLYAAWVEAEQFAARRELQPAMQAWDTYVALLNEYRADERAYREIHEFQRFQVSLLKARLLTAMTVELAPPGDDDGAIVGRIGHLKQVAGHLGNYLRQFNNPAAVPGDVTRRDRFAATYDLGENLWRQGLSQARLGQIRAARDNFEAARTLLKSAIEAMLGDALRKPRTPVKNAPRTLAPMTDLYLRQVEQVDEPAAYVADAAAAIEWLPRDEPAVVEQIARQAGTWHEQGRNLVEAAKLCELVRTTGQQYFLGSGTDEAFRIWTLFIEMQIAFETKAKDKALGLIDDLITMTGGIGSDPDEADWMRAMRQTDLNPPRAQPNRGELPRGTRGNRLPPSRGAVEPAPDVTPTPARPDPEPDLVPARLTDSAVPGTALVATGAVVMMALLGLALLHRRGAV